MTLLHAFGALGTVGIGIAMVVLGLLSGRLGAATQSGRLYVGFFIAGGLLGLSALFQIGNAIFSFEPFDSLSGSPGWVMVYLGLPAIAITLGLLLAWHYWSWLLAERD
jgi:hypothetical protein